MGVYNLEIIINQEAAVVVVVEGEGAGEGEEVGEVEEVHQ